MALRYSTGRCSSWTCAWSPPDRGVCERIASELRAEGAENRLVERGTAVRHGLLGLYGRRVQRGEGNPLPSFHKGVFASTELAAFGSCPRSTT